MTALRHALCFFQHDAGNLHMTIGLLIKGRSNYFGPYTPGHVCYFFRTFVNKQNNEIHFGMVFRDGIGDLFQQNRLTCFRLGHNHTTLSFANRCEEVKDAGGHIIRSSAELQLFIWEKRCKVFERYTVADFFSSFSIHIVHLEEGEIFFSFFGWANLALYRVTGF